jgi:hypothetical protein
VTPKIVPAVNLVGTLDSFPLSPVHEDLLCIYDDTCSSLPGDYEEFDIDSFDNGLEPIFDGTSPILGTHEVFLSTSDDVNSDELQTLFLDIMGM